VTQVTYEVLPGTRAPVKLWADPAKIEEGALRQLRNVASLPWTRQVAVMPDVHYGIGATVGSVIAMERAISPAAVGVDIGCGMSAVRSSLTASELPDNLSRVRSAIESKIPVGFGAHGQPVQPGHGSGGWESFWNEFHTLHAGVQQREHRARQQMGTLGGGNHFIELCVEQGGPDAGRVWLMLHSGSRNIGKELAERHMEKARSLPHNSDLPDRSLAVFLAGTPEMDAYRHDLWWAQEYAARNRATMLRLGLAAVESALRGRQVSWDEPISCHHNYVAEETHDGLEVLVTRKGAIRAGKGDMGIIPGSMGTGSYIVRGLGNSEAMCSASHGAGRKMSRSAAKRKFTKADLAKQTAGVECRKDSGVLDEIPGAYKDIADVIARQADLVEVVHHLKQVVCVKG
jgi:tRNA-splicing ligase RtcB (3'-phosphate/5'-hydroxy nucleic acid ligase)